MKIKHKKEKKEIESVKFRSKIKRGNLWLERKKKKKLLKKKLI